MTGQAPTAQAPRGRVRPGPPLIGLAHGSRHGAVRGAIDDLLAAVQRLSGAPPTHSAFLDLTAPDLQARAAELAASGETAGVVVPLLFTSAFHARIDAPGKVSAAIESSGLQLRLAPVLGTGEEVAEVVGQALERSGISQASQLMLYAVGSSDPAANQSVTQLAQRLSDQRQAPVRAAFATVAPYGIEVAATLTPPAAIVPLFVAPGLLLHSIGEVARERSLTMVPPLGELLAPLVLRRYREALGRPADSPLGQAL